MTDPHFTTLRGMWNLSSPSPPPRRRTCDHSSSSASAGLSSSLLLHIAIAVVLQLVVTTAQEQVVGGDWIVNVPDTVYESAPFRYQNADFDALNNLFVAHEVYVNNRVTHQYKFKVYSDEEGYTALNNARNLPINKLYIVVTDTDNYESTVVGQPILAYHHVDGALYSDFVHLHVVPVPTESFYEANLYQSEGDILSNGQPILETGILINMPLVPRNSRLQDPRTGSTTRAPINPVLVWYKGVTVQTFVFEVTDQRAATLFANTRQVTTNNNNDQDTTTTSEMAQSQFGITVLPTMGSVLTGLTAMNWYYFNMYTRGVTEGVNNGGPFPQGMRNIVPYERLNPQYSPLLQTRWMSSVPMNFSADQVSSITPLIPSNGFTAEVAPLFVNGPLIGPVNAQENPNTVDNFLSSVSINRNVNLIQGAALSFRFTSGLPVELLTQGGVRLASTNTTSQGAYSISLSTFSIPTGTRVLLLRTQGLTFRTLDVKDYIAEPPMTWYEDPSSVTHFNFDYDLNAQQFVPHPTWYNDRLTHMYKFVLYSAQYYYSDVLSSTNDGTTEVSVANIPLNRMYLVTPGTVAQIIGRPILAQHHVDGDTYSDFVEVIFVRPPPGYTTDQFRSEGDVLGNSNAQRISMGIVLNAPVVPVGATLRDPAAASSSSNSSSSMAVLPNVPTPNVWYRGVLLPLMVFDSTDIDVALFFDPTRQFITVHSNFYNPSTGILQDAPLYFLNQYTHGVTSGTNGGGPSTGGMRNIIGTERGQGDYTPLWNWNWVSQLPVNYENNQASSVEQVSDTNQGFVVERTNVWMNGPCVGTVGSTPNPDKLGDGSIFLQNLPRTGEFIIQGGPTPLVMQPGTEVIMETPTGNRIQTVRTNYMGGYQFELLSSAIPNTADELIVAVPSIGDEGTIVRTLEKSGDTAPTVAVISGSTPLIDTPMWQTVLWSTGMALLTFILW